MKHVLALTFVLALAGAAHAQIDFPAGHFPEQTGEALYKGVCQGCHMPQAQGAVGAGAYPALAGDHRLQTSAYPALVILKGQKAMPSFGDLSDAQVAGVINYIRTLFGNDYKDAVTAEDVRVVRP